MSANLLSSALALLLAAGASAQSVFVVAPTLGPGVFSTQIQPAIDAAADGDLVLVKAGTYSGFTINAKGVSVIADAGASVVVNGFVFVSSLSGSQRVLLQRLVVHGDNSLPAITLANDLGAVWIESCSATGGTNSSSGLGGISVNSSPSVLIQRSFMTGGGGASGSFTSAGADGIHVANSTVVLSDSRSTGGNGAPTFTGGPSAGYGGSGARVLSGFVFASGTVFQGGNGAAPVPPQFLGGGGGAGISTSPQGTVTTLQCTSAGGLGQGGLPNGPPTVGSVQIINDVARHFSIASPVREGQSTTTTAKGVVGEIAGLWFSPAPAPPLMLLPFEGALALSPVGADGFTLGTIPAGGTLSMPLAVPTLPAALQSTIVWCQSIFFDAPLTYVVIGPTSALVILDAAL